MALTKRVKVGGGYYKGQKCSVSANPADYTAVIALTAGAALNAFSITPDAYGAGDTMKVEHMDDVAGTGKVIAILAEDIYNIGKNGTIMLDLPAAEQVNNGESIKFVYTNTATVAMNVYLIAEYVGLKKTA